MDMKKTRVLLVGNTSWYLNNFRLGLMKRLKADGAQVYFCSPPDECADKLITAGFGYYPIKFDRKGINPFLEIKLIFDLMRTYRKARPDIVLHFTPKMNIYGSIAAKLSGAPCINTITGLGFAFTGNRIFSGFVKLLYRISSVIAVKTFFQNTDDMNLFLKEELVLDSKAMLVKGSGVDTDYFSPATRVKKDEGKEKEFIFLLYGRILFDKGVGEFVRAAHIIKKEFPGIEFWILGFVDHGNPAKIKIEQLRRWHADGTIKYYESTADVKPFLSRADCVVLPSYREGMPKSLLEAMSMEKPIITTDVPGCRDVVEDNINGLKIPAKNYEALVLAMRKMLLLSSDARLKMGEAGRKKAVSEFNEEKVIQAYVNSVGSYNNRSRI